MDFLSLLTNAMTSESSVNSISNKSGIDSSDITKLLIKAIPVLIAQLTSNASSEQGAQSLLGALGQHTSTASIESQIANADTVDGSKILSHILGGNSSSVLGGLSNQTGLDESQVSGVLSNITPAMLSSLSATTTAASKAQKNQKKGIDLSDGLDMDELAQLYGGAQTASASKGSSAGMDDFLGSLMGMSGSGASSSKKTASKSSGMGMLDALMGGDISELSSSKSSSSGMDDILGSFLGGGGSKSKKSGSDSSDLLKSLMKLMY